MRLDQRLVAEGLAESRTRARALIAAGVVRLDGRVVSKPSAAAPLGLGVALTGDPLPWVSRAALKLLHALDHFNLAPRGVALDLGASTGGFTEVLLARGAAHVHALDVGHGQMHPRIAADPRVTLHEGVNARAIPAGLLPRIDWVTADLSFISLEKALPSALDFAVPGAGLVALVKPQFEAGPEAVGKGGVVRDQAVRDAAATRVADGLDRCGWQVTGLTDSPITGQGGNQEALIAAYRRG